MKNLCFRVITMALCLYFTGTVANPSRKSSIFFNSECIWNGYLLKNCSFTGKYDIPVDIPQTAATVDVGSNFFKVLLQSPMKEEEWNIKHLDLSNNLISRITLRPLAHLHGLEILNLSNNAIHSISLDLPSPKSSWVKRHRSSLRNGLPHLRLLILQRNKLSDVPRGLWKLKSLQSLDLSFNGILQIGVSDFYKCLQMKNLYLRSNKIFKIHPEAFKDLKKLQVVDLSNNALTAVLPMVIIALERPHLEADLAGNQWQCNVSMAVFQNLMSESWRRQWGVICNKSVGHEPASWTPRSRIPREPQLPRADLSPTQSLLGSPAAGPREGTPAPLPAMGRDHAGPQSPGPQRRPPRRARSAQDAEAASQDLALAVCLSVFITFFVAFCLGALTRPYADRLWQQRCARKRPGPDCAYSNEGFCETEVAGDTRHPRVDPRQACHGLTLCETRDPFSGPEASPQAAVADRTPGLGRKERGDRRSRAQCRGDAAAGRSTGDALPSGHPRAGAPVLGSARQGHICRNDILGEMPYETEALGESPGEYPAGVPVKAGRLGTGSGPTHKDSDEFHPPLSREMTAALSKARTRAKAQRAGENKEGAGTEQLPSESSKDLHVGTSIVQQTQGPRLQGASSEEDRPTSYSWATLSALGQVGPSPPAFPPGRGSDPRVTSADEEPVQKHAPPGTQCEPDTDDDSDEGSLFTLSSVSTEGARSVSEEEADDEESHRSSEPPEDGDSAGREGNGMPFKSPEDSITFQKTPGKCENQKDRFEKPLISSSDSGLYKSHQENAPTTYDCEDPLTRSPGSSPSRGEMAAPQPEAAGWHRSLRDLDFLNVDTVPQTPPCAVEVPSGPEKTAHREGRWDTCSCEPFLQGTDTKGNSIPFRITTGENARPSQQGSEGGNMHSGPRDSDAHEGSGCPLGDPGSRDSIRPTQLSQLCGDEAALQCGRGGGERFEEGSKSQTPLLQELPNKTSSLRTQEPLSDGDRGEYSEETVLRLGEDDSNFFTQMQTQKNLMGTDGCVSEDQLYSDTDEDIQLEAQRERK